MSGNGETSTTMGFGEQGILLGLFITLFIFTPYGSGIRDISAEIWALFYWIDFTITGIFIDAPFPSRNFNSIPSHFWWINLLQICFALSVILHFSGLISRRNTLIAGGIGLVTPVLTFIMNGLGTLITGNLIIFIPLPIPTLFGLLILRSRSRPKIALWNDESDNT